MADKKFEAVIFGKVTFSSLLQDIYKNSKKTEEQISQLIMDLSPMIKSPGEAVIIVPLIKEYMEVKVKNDEHLVKMAAIVQRAVAADKKDEEGNLLITEAEKEALMREVESFREIKLLKN